MRASIESAGTPGKANVVQLSAPIAAPDFSWVIGSARMVWPNKTAETLCVVTGASLRTVRYWLAGKHAPQGLAALRLLRALRAELNKRQAYIEQLELPLD